MLLEDYWRYIFHTQTPWLWQGTWVFFFRRWRNRKQVLSKIYISSYEMFYDQLNQEIVIASTTISPTQRRRCSSRLYFADTDGRHRCPPSPASCFSHSKEVPQHWMRNPPQLSRLTFSADPHKQPLPRSWAFPISQMLHSPSEAHQLCLKPLSMPGQARSFGDKALTSLLCSTGFYILITVTGFSLF